LPGTPVLPILGGAGTVAVQTGAPGEPGSRQGCVTLAKHRGYRTEIANGYRPKRVPTKRIEIYLAMRALFREV